MIPINIGGCASEHKFRWASTLIRWRYAMPDDDWKLDHSGEAYILDEYDWCAYVPVEEEA